MFEDILPQRNNDMQCYKRKDLGPIHVRPTPHMSISTPKWNRTRPLFEPSLIPYLYQVWTRSHLSGFIVQLMRALHRCRRGHGFESRWISGSRMRQYLRLSSKCDDYFFSSSLNQTTLHKRFLSYITFINWSPRYVVYFHDTLSWIITLLGCQ